MKSSIRGTILLALLPVVLLYAQAASKPENGFISRAKYTNAFFGFSLPLPQDAQLKLLVENAPKHGVSRHILFAANSTGEGYPVIVVGADEIIGSGNADPKRAVLAFGAKKVDVVQIDGREFSRGTWRADRIYRVAYVTRLSGYMLFISTFTFDQKVLDEFERSIQGLTFFDPAKVLEFAGPNAQKYDGPDEPATPATGQQDTNPNAQTPVSQAGAEPNASAVATTKPGEFYDKELDGPDEPATPATGQQDTNPNAQTPVSQAGAEPNASAVATTKPGEFYDKELDLHFNYPVEMHPVDASAAIELGHERIYGVFGDNDPEHQEAIHCTRPLLDADLPEDKAPQRDANLGGVWVDDSQAYKESRKPEPIFATILLVEIVRDCLPKKLQKNDDSALAAIALSFVSEPGIQRMPKPLWYNVGKQKIHMNSGAGRLITNGKLATAPIIVMSMATKWRGHLLAWVFTSNDTEIFNEITKSLVQFGNGPWGPMFAANIGPRGSGKPMTILPK